MIALQGKMKAQTFVKARHIGLAVWGITIKIEAGCGITETLRDSLCKSGPLRFASENRFLLNFAHEYILVQK